jgi:hypothetical protein
MSDWRAEATEQNLRLAQKMLEQQGEINRLVADLQSARVREKVAATAIGSAEARIAELEQRRDKVLGYVVDLEQGLSDDGRDLPPGFKHIRTFLTGDQGEGA